MVAALVRWSFETLARRISDCLLQYGLPGCGDGGPMTAARLWLGPALVVVARWSIDLVVIFIISYVLCTIMIDE